MSKKYFKPSLIINLEDSDNIGKSEVQLILPTGLETIFPLKY